jgi:regulatory protein YycH of two-component signal transduction system YycFG
MISASARQVLDDHEVRYPSLRDDIGTIRLQFTERLWHQLAEELGKYCKQKVF